MTGSDKTDHSRKALSRHRILFFAEAVTLAHVVRPLVLARSLDASQWEVRLATDSRFEGVIGDVPFPVERIWTIAPERFRHALQRGTPIYDAGSLDRYVTEELRLIERFQPDAVVGDFRVSLGISVRKAKLPYVNIANAYWSPHAAVRHVVPEIALAGILPLRVAQALFDLFRRPGYALHAFPVNKVRRKYGLAPLPPDFRWAIVDGDATLYADIPEVVPMRKLPQAHRFAGPIPWSPSVKLPDWWQEVEAAAAAQRIVYVNLGSSGIEGGLERVLKVLEPLPLMAIAATAGRREPVPATRNSRVAEYLPGDECVRLASAVVCNGGSPAAYQALAQGRPVVGFAANADQFLNMAAVEDAGCGVLLRAHSADQSAIREAVTSAMSDQRLARGAHTARDSIASRDPSKAFQTALEEVLGHATT